MRLNEKLGLLLVPLILLPQALLVGAILYLLQRPEDLSARAIETVTWMVSGALFFMLLGSLRMVRSVARSIAQPLQHLTTCVQRLARGDRTTPVQLEEVEGELDELALDIEMLRHQLVEFETKLQTQSALEATGRLAAQVVHDIASPLTSLQTAVEYFSRLPETSRATSDRVNLLELGLKRLRGIADNLLQHHSGQENIPALFSLHHVLDELLGEFDGQRHTTITIIKRYHPTAIHLVGNRSLLQRAFGNIMKNAIEAMQGTGTLTVRTSLQGSDASVEISDSGCGMSADVLARIMDGGQSIGKVDGHGIGMAVVSQTVRALEGTLTAHSVVGSGTTFCLALPLPSSRHLRDVPSVSAEEGGSLSIALVPHTPVFVIDDDPILRTYWQHLLETAGWPVVLCESYEEYLEKIDAHDAVRNIIVDYHFDNSEMNGADIVQRLRAQEIANIYLCTAEYWKPSLRAQAEQLRVAIIPKPLPHIEFVESIAVALTPIAPAIAASPVANVLVIDDDEGIRFAWEIEQEKLGITHLHAFASMEEFIASQFDVRNIDIAFVDKHVEGSAWKLLDTVRDLKSRGIPRVIIASGESPTELRQSIEAKFADGVASPKIPESLAPHLEAPVRLRVVDGAGHV